MLKLERKERLERIQVARLINERQLLRDGEIAKAHHRLEAEFYEQEHRRTGNKWNIVNAISDWRKAGELEQALNLTQNLNWQRISDHKLKAALLTNRGFVLRDQGDYSDSEECAMQSIQLDPQRPEPYLLMATLCFRQANFASGDIWRQKAIERGANPGDLDYEMKRLVKNAKNAEERKQLVDYLLKTDPQRYGWVKEYQKQSAE
jgi:tetratricopeptide (TPR) repeat protein